AREELRAGRRRKLLDPMALQLTRLHVLAPRHGHRRARLAVRAHALPRPRRDGAAVAMTGRGLTALALALAASCPAAASAAPTLARAPIGDLPWLSANAVPLLWIQADV